MGIEWQYEPEGFEKRDSVCAEEDAEHLCGDDCYEITRYLPDFYLPKTETWVEVKGSNEAMAADASRLEHFLDFGSPLPGFNNSADYPRRFGKTNGLLILGEVPFLQWGFVLHPIIRHYKGLDWNWAMFTGESIEVIGREASAILTTLVDRTTPDEWTTQGIAVETPRAVRKVVEAYQSARAARFEHGEHGGPVSISAILQRHSAGL